VLLFPALVLALTPACAKSRSDDVEGGRSGMVTTSSSAETGGAPIASSSSSGTGGGTTASSSSVRFATPPTRATRDCAARAMAAGRFDPSCPDYQGYLDPGTKAGRAPTSGEMQMMYLCKEGRVPRSECKQRGYRDGPGP
jgi:hypothetical protein